MVLLYIVLYLIGDSEQGDCILVCIKMSRLIKHRLLGSIHLLLLLVWGEKLELVNKFPGEADASEVKSPFGEAQF